jgi:hypothetical protein
MQYVKGVRRVIRRLRNQDYRPVRCSLQVSDDIRIGLFEVDVIGGRRVFRADDVRAIDIGHMFSVKNLFFHFPRLTDDFENPGKWHPFIRDITSGGYCGDFCGDRKENLEPK